jgi:hypothetical protein
VRLSQTLPTNRIEFFANPLGSTDPVSGLAKTEEETNLNQQRSFGQNFFIITQIRTDLNLLCKARQSQAIATNALSYSAYPAFNRDWEHQALFQGVLNIKIGGKDYQLINNPLLTCPPGFGYKYLNIPAQYSLGPLTENKGLVKQKSKGNAVYNLEPVQLIEPQRSFQFSITYPQVDLPSLVGSWYASSVPVEPYVNMGLILDGYIARPNA